MATITGVLSACFMHLYIAVVVVYNLVRLIVIPFYIAIQMVRHPDWGFRLSDIPKEMALSVKNVVDAPSFGIPLFIASFYTTVDPFNGIKLGSGVEYEWNKHVPMRNRGVWLMGTTIFNEWAWEGGGRPGTLGQNGFYYAGSWLPIREIEVGEGNIIRDSNRGVGGVSANLDRLYFNDVDGIMEANAQQEEERAVFEEGTPTMGIIRYDRL